MIEGFRCDVKGTELQAHCQERAKAHETEWKRYVEKLGLLHDTKSSMLKEHGVINKDELGARLDATNFKGSANESDIERKASHHRERTSYFKYASEHLVVGETYRLATEDLTKLEIITGHY